MVGETSLVGASQRESTSTETENELFGVPPSITFTVDVLPMNNGISRREKQECRTLPALLRPNTPMVIFLKRRNVVLNSRRCRHRLTCRLLSFDLVRLVWDFSAMQIPCLMSLLVN